MKIRRNYAILDINALFYISPMLCIEHTWYTQEHRNTGFTDWIHVEIHKSIVGIFSDAKYCPV